MDPAASVTVMGVDEGLSISKVETRLTPVGSKIVSFPVGLGQKMLGGPMVVQINGEYFAMGVSLWADGMGGGRGFRFYRYIFDKLN